MRKNVFIIGAPRSGTNILRDTITKLDEFETWPCDEINHIWRHYNTRMYHDRFNKSHAKPKVKKYLTNKFKAVKFKNQSKYLVEKTCANSLRIPFINEIFRCNLYNNF